MLNGNGCILPCVSLISVGSGGRDSTVWALQGLAWGPWGARETRRLARWAWGAQETSLEVPSYIPSSLLVLNSRGQSMVKGSDQCLQIPTTLPRGSWTWWRSQSLTWTPGIGWRVDLCPLGLLCPHASAMPWLTNNKSIIFIMMVTNLNSLSNNPFIPFI